MQVSVQFNWPPGKATLLVGGRSIQDRDREYFIGIAHKDGQGQKKDWSVIGRAETVKVPVDHGDKVIVKSRDKGTGELGEHFAFSVDREWPAGAMGGTNIDRTIGFL